MLRFDPLRPASGPVLDRRRFIIGAAGLAASAAWPVRLWAAEAPFSFKQGDFEISVVSDGHLTLPANIFAGDAPPDVRKALFDAAGLGGENIMPGRQSSPDPVRLGSDPLRHRIGHRLPAHCRQARRKPDGRRTFPARGSRAGRLG